MLADVMGMAEGWSIANLLYMICIQFGCPILLQFINIVVARVNTRNWSNQSLAIQVWRTTYLNLLESVRLHLEGFFSMASGGWFASVSQPKGVIPCYTSANSLMIHVIWQKKWSQTLESCKLSPTFVWQSGWQVATYPTWWRKRRTKPRRDWSNSSGAVPHQLWIWFNLYIAMERSTIFKNGKPSINGPSIPWLCWITRG